MFIVGRKESYKGKVLDIFSYLYVFIAMFGSTIAPQLLQNTESVWLVPRSTYAFGSILGLTLLLIMLKKPKNEYFKKTLIAVSFIVLFIQFYSFTKIESNLSSPFPVLGKIYLKNSLHISILKVLRSSAVIDRISAFPQFTAKWQYPCTPC